MLISVKSMPSIRSFSFRSEALRLLTRERGSYDEYVERIATAGNRIAVLVKRADLGRQPATLPDLPRTPAATLPEGAGATREGDSMSRRPRDSRQKARLTLTPHKMSVKHMDRYLEELEWRYNNRDNPYVFPDTLRRIMDTDPARVSGSGRLGNIGQVPALDGCGDQ